MRHLKTIVWYKLHRINRLTNYRNILIWEETRCAGVLPCSRILLHEKQLWMFLAISSGKFPAIEPHEDQDGSEIKIIKFN